MKILNNMGLSLVTIGLLAGCGNSSSSGTTTGTGYYVDAAVGGLSYICGSQEGTTDEDGKFTFEVGQSCTFKIGNIELPVVEASELKDGAKFIEDDARTTQFLQSLDDASDGTITITPELIAILDKKDVVAIPEDATALQELVKTIEEEAKVNEAFTFTGYYVTPEAAAEHVAGTQDDVAGEVAAVGVKFTFPSKFYHDVRLDSNYNNGKSTEQFEAEVFEFTSDKKFKFNEIVFTNGEFILDTNANSNDTDYKLVDGKWVEQEEGFNPTTVFSENDTLATLDDIYKVTIESIKDIEGKSKSIENSSSVTMPKDAKEIAFGLEVLKEDYEIHENTNLTLFSEMLKSQCDSHYFTHAKEDSGIRGIAFACGQESQTSGTLVGVKDDNTLLTNGVGTWEIKTIENTDVKALLVTIDAKYNQHSDSPMFAMKDGNVWRGYYDSIGKKEPMITYNQKAFDAITAKIVELSDTGSSSNALTITPTLLSEKVFYLKHDENNGAETSYNKLEVISSTQVKVHEIRKNKTTGIIAIDIENTFSYFLVNGILRLKPDGDNFFMDFTLTSKDALEWNFSVNENNEGTFTDTWYLSKPADYPAGI